MATAAAAMVAAGWAAAGWVTVVVEEVEVAEAAPRLEVALAAARAKEELALAKEGEVMAAVPAMAEEMVVTAGTDSAAHQCTEPSRQCLLVQDPMSGSMPRVRCLRQHRLLGGPTHGGPRRSL